MHSNDRTNYKFLEKFKFKKILFNVKKLKQLRNKCYKNGNKTYKF